MCREKKRKDWLFSEHDWQVWSVYISKERSVLFIWFVLKALAWKSVELAELLWEVPVAAVSGGAADGGGYQEIQHPKPWQRTSHHDQGQIQQKAAGSRGSCSLPQPQKSLTHCVLQWCHSDPLSVQYISDITTSSIRRESVSYSKAHFEPASCLCSILLTALQPSFLLHTS